MSEFKRKKYNFCKVIINCSFIAAILAAGSASYWGGYQQKEPDDIMSVIKKYVLKKKMTL